MTKDNVCCHNSMEVMSWKEGLDTTDDNLAEYILCLQCLLEFVTAQEKVLAKAVILPRLLRRSLYRVFNNACPESIIHSYKLAIYVDLEVNVFFVD